MPKFIVISGRKGSGKTTSANMIKDLIMERNTSTIDTGTGPRTIIPRVLITSFATPIKEMCSDILGLAPEQIYGTEEQKNSLTAIKWDRLPEEIRLRYSNTEEKYYFQPPTEYSVTEVRYRPAVRSGPMTAREVMQILGTDIFRNYLDCDVWAKAPFNKYSKSDYDYIIIDDCRFPNEADIARKNSALLFRLTRRPFPMDTHISEVAMDTYSVVAYTGVIDNAHMDLENLREVWARILTRHGVINAT